MKTLFLHNKKWFTSEPTSYGFKHTLIGNVTNFPTKELAEARVVEMAEREVAA